MNKSPGPDGFIGEYYKTFKLLLTPYLEHIFNAVADSCFLPPKMLKALIVTLPKPWKESNSPRNFRPISLLNADLKFYAKLIATRLLAILSLLLHPDQTGFSKGRQTTDAICQLTNIIHLAKLDIILSLL